MKNLKYKIFVVLPALFSARFAFAAEACPTDFGSLTEIVDWGTCVMVRTLIPALIVLATLVFMYGALKFIKDSDNEDSREEGRQFMLWGIIGLFVMVSVWGLVAVLQNTFFDGPLIVPQL